MVVTLVHWGYCCCSVSLPYVRSLAVECWPNSSHFPDQFTVPPSPISPESDSFLSGEWTFSLTPVKGSQPQVSQPVHFSSPGYRHKAYPFQLVFLTVVVDRRRLLNHLIWRINVSMLPIVWFIPGMYLPVFVLKWSEIFFSRSMQIDSNFSHPGNICFERASQGIFFSMDKQTDKWAVCGCIGCHSLIGFV